MARVEDALYERYRQALTAYISDDAVETELADGYGVGRAALDDKRGLIDLLAIHQSALLAAIADLPRATVLSQIAAVAKAEEFLTQVAAPFEMIHLGWGEAVDRLRRLNASLERQVAERTQEFRESERRFHDIAEVSGDWMWETNREHRFTMVLGEHAGALSIRGDSLIGRTRWEGAGADPASNESWARHQADLDAHRTFRHFRYTTCSPAGAPLYISVSGKPVFDPNGNFLGYRGTATDETAAVEAQHRAEAAEATTRRIFENSLDLILVTDRTGRFVRVSPSAMSILGYHPDEMVGCSAEGFLYPEDLENTRNEMRKARRDGLPQNFECRYVHRQGQIVTLWWTGVWSAADQQYYFTGRDITERNEAERRLRDSEDQLKRAQRIAHMGSNFTDLRTGSIEWSDETYRIFGVSRDAFVPTSDSIVRVLYPEDRAKVSAIMAGVRQGRAPDPFEYRLIRPDGTVRHVYRESAIVNDDDGNPRYLIGTIHDITERRQTEEQLRQAQKMEAIGNLTGGMAHDFNNLLAIIVGNLGLASEQLGDAEELSELVNEAMDAAWRGADLTRRLLAFARQQPLRPARIEVNELIGDTARLLRRLLGEDIEVRLDLAGDVWSIVADPAQLEASLANLATNARDAMPRGGRLIIATANRHLDADYAAEHAEVSEGDFTMIEVSDNGTGMTPEVMRRIFEPFFTTKEAGKGSGLGLSMVFGFLRQSGGHVSVYSEPGFGTTFRLYLPRATSEIEPTDTPPEAVVERGGGEVVLVVEDNPHVRRIVVRQLHELGYRVVECERATQALDVLQRETVNLLFTDIVMPGGLDGVELARLVRERWPTLKIVLTSGFPQARIDIAPGALDGIQLLSKPYRQQELSAVLHAALQG